MFADRVVDRSSVLCEREIVWGCRSILFGFPSLQIERVAIGEHYFGRRDRGFDDDADGHSCGAWHEVTVLKGIAVVVGPDRKRGLKDGG